MRLLTCKKIFSKRGVIIIKKLSIKDIYVGKPDAKDEIGFDGIEAFVKSFVIPDTFSIDGLLHGNNCFITGYKGTGKTALLFYLEYLLKSETPYACSSFIFFKDEFTETRKQELEGFSKRIMSCITIENGTMITNTDFEYIWRWLFFKRIVADNEEYNNGLYVNDTAWNRFTSTVSKIKAPTDKKKSIIPPKIKIVLPIKDAASQTEITPEIEVDFQKNNDNSNYTKFSTLIDEAEKEFSQLTRTDIPYYIFVDELEAYFGNENVFIRDLYLIRDLLFTIKRFNNYFVVNKTKTKVICSVRAEIINAISRFVVTKELNKITGGFEVPLIWNYSNTSSYTHPIIQILLKRIFISENKEVLDYKDIYTRWLPEKIHDIEPANYILNNGWNKPRDIVRMISSVQSSIKAYETSFNQAVFDAIKKKYSLDSLLEIKEEMRALYTAEEIETIINCFTGFKTKFSVQQLRVRISDYYFGSILEKKFNQVLQDLYRLGFLGNYLPASQTYRWQHKGDEGIILSDEWRLMVHYALQGALSIGRKQDIGLLRKETLEKGDMVIAVVSRVIPSFALVEINHYGKKYSGSIHVGKLNKGYIKDIFNVVSEGDEFRAMVLDYNEKYKCWNLSLEYEPPIDEE